MYQIIWSSQFKKDYKLAIKRNYNIEELDNVIRKLAQGEPLDSKYNDHQLSGNYAKFRECHIRPNWLLIYAIDNGKLVLTLSRTGSHSDLFKM